MRKRKIVSIISWVLIFSLILFTIDVSKLLYLNDNHGLQLTALAAAPAHVHSDACYEGTQHVHSGNSYSGTGCYTGSYTPGQTYNCGSWSVTGSYSSSAGTCPMDGGQLSYNSLLVRCNTCGTTSSTMYSCSCSKCSYGWINGIGSHERSTSGYYNLGCGKTAGVYYNSNGTVSNSICNQVVTGMTPINANQTINVDGTVNCSATATFLDGHIENVTCSQTGLNMTNYNTVQTVTLNYGTYSNTAKNKLPFKSNIAVTVNGYFYTLNFNPNGGSTCSPKTVSYKTTLGILPVPIKTGYTFSHWEDSSKNTITASNLYNWNENITLYAVYTTNNYSIQLQNTSTGATGASPSQPYGSVVNLYAGIKDGFFFTGWKDLNGNVVLANSSRASTTFIMPAGDVNLQATWKKTTGIQADLNDNFRNTYLEYFNGTAYNIDYQNIMVDNNMLDVRVNFDDGSYLMLSDDQYTLENSSIKNVGENIVKVKLDGFIYENNVRITGYSFKLSYSLTALSAGTYIDFSWSSNKYDYTYELELDGKIVKTGFVTSYRYSGLKPSTQHTYRLKTINVAGIIQWSPIQTIFTSDGTITKAPENISTKATNDKIIITWDVVNDAEEYDINLISPDGTSGDAINNGNNTTCELSGLNPNTTYMFQIRAKNVASDGPWSEMIQTTTKQLDTPQNIITKCSDTSILFSWDKVKDATYYKLKLNGMELVDPIYDTSYSYTTTPNTQYTYSIMAVGSTGESNWREEKRIFSLPAKPDTPTNVFATVSDSKITVMWTKVVDTSVNGYDIELDKIEDNEIVGDEIILENGTDTVYTHDELEPYSLYSYRVRARNNMVESDWSEIRYIRTLPAKPITPTDIIIRSTQTGATLTWKAELGATGYDLYVYRLDENDNEVIMNEIKNIKECSYTHRKQTYGEEYRYRIRTRNVQGISDWSCDIINNAIKAECKKNNSIDLGLTATDVVDFSSYEMVVTYNTGVIEVTDLSTLTGKEEITIGRVEGTNVSIKEFSNGRIVFVVDKVVNPGEAWTGVINGIKFKAKETGGTTITYTVFTKPQQ